MFRRKSPNLFILKALAHDKKKKKRELLTKGKLMHIHKEEERRSYPKEAGETRPQGLTSLPGRTAGLCHPQSSKANTNMNLALPHCILFELQLVLHAQGFNHQTGLKTQLAPEPPLLCCCPAADIACVIPRDHQPHGSALYQVQSGDGCQFVIDF